MLKQSSTTLFLLDTGVWLAASKETGSVRALISPPEPVKEVIYFCKSNRNKSQLGKRKKSDVCTGAQMQRPEGIHIKPFSFASGWQQCSWFRNTKCPGCSCQLLAQQVLPITRAGSAVLLHPPQVTGAKAISSA